MSMERIAGSVFHQSWRLARSKATTLSTSREQLCEYAGIAEVMDKWQLSTRAAALLENILKIMKLLCTKANFLCGLEWN